MEWLKEFLITLENTFDRERAFENVRSIYENDRHFDNAHFNKTAGVVASLMAEAGLCNIEMLPLKADGMTRYGDWVIPRAWDAYRGELRIASPRVEDDILCDYARIPCSLVMYSQNTPKDGVIAEVVDVDAALDPSKLNLKGKIILTGRYNNRWTKLALEKGVIGVISDFLPKHLQVRDNVDEMNGHSRWENDFLIPVNDTGIFGFCLSPDAGKRLRALMAKGSVNLHALVDVRHYDGVNYTVSGVIPGVDPDGEEVMFCGHLYEPGANDNATGCGAMIELAAAINRLISQGAIPRPQRSIRFVLGFESTGMIGYAMAHPESVSRTIAALSIDMIGSTPQDRAIFRLIHNPVSNFSCMDILLPSVIRQWEILHDTQTAAVEAACEVENNPLADPMFGVPTVTMIMHPALSYHSSMDDMSMVDAGVLARNAVIAGAAMLLCADIGRQAAEAASELFGSEYIHPSPFTGEAASYIKWFLRYQIRQSSMIIFGRYTDSIDIWDSKSGSETETPPPFRPAAGPMAERIPKRNVPGPLTLRGKYKHGEWPAFNPNFNYRYNCPLYWTNGKRSLGEIAALAAAELGLTDLGQYLTELTRYYEMLSDLGYITFI